MGILREMLEGVLRGLGTLGTPNQDNEAYADIEYLDIDGRGNWKYGGRVVNYGSGISEKMRQIAQQRPGRRVRAVDMNSRHVIDILN